jgi:hypothetical protein
MAETESTPTTPAKPKPPECNVGRRGELFYTDRVQGKEVLRSVGHAQCVAINKDGTIKVRLPRGGVGPLAEEVDNVEVSAISGHLCFIPATIAKAPAPTANNMIAAPAPMVVQFDGGTMEKLVQALAAIDVLTLRMDAAEAELKALKGE